MKVYNITNRILQNPHYKMWREGGQNSISDRREGFILTTLVRVT